MDTFADMYLGNWTPTLSQPVFDRCLAYYETATRETANEEWIRLRRWMEDLFISNKIFEENRKAALNHYHEDNPRGPLMDDMMLVRKGGDRWVKS